jgi:hypothetical protein
MSITKKHPVVQAIMDSEELEDEDKIIALNGLLILKYSNLRNEDNLSSLFLWRSSYLGFEFWNDINKIVFESKF